MAQRRSLAWRELRVGLLVIASFVILAAAIFFIGGEAGFFTPKYEVTAFFPSANGLRGGAEVWLEGVQIGNVRTVRINEQPDPNRSVRIEMRLDRRFQNIIRTDSTVSISTIGLLGDQNVQLTRGTERGDVIPDGGFLVGTEKGDIRRIITGTDDFIANLNVLGDKVVEMSERIDRGEGTLGKILTDSAVYDNLNKATVEVSKLISDARTGPGTMGRLISDDQMYHRLTSTLGRMDSLVARMERGEGTIGKFMTDSALYNRADGLFQKFDSVVGRIDRGEGTLGRFSKDEELYNKMTSTMVQFSTLISTVQNGDGAAGKLIRDPALYNNMNQTMSEIQKLLYDFRQDPKKFLTINFKLF